MPTPSDPLAWQPAEPPTRPRLEPEVVVVEDALLTRAASGRTHTIAEPTRWVRGAVYDAEGRLVPQSQNVRGHGSAPRLPVDPPRVGRSSGERTERLAGRWLYGGTLVPGHGPFVAETLSALWTDPEPVAGVLFHRHGGDDAVEEWQRRLVELAGWGGVPIHVVWRRSQPVQVEELVVPSRSVALNAWAHPEARRVWDRVAAPFRAAGGPERVHLSRAGEDADAELDAVFERHGFTVVTPGRRGVEELLTLVAGARVLAGRSGPDLLRSAFLPAGSRVVEIGDRRTPRKAAPMQLAVDAVSGHGRCFLDGGSTPAAVDAALGAVGL